MFILFSPITSGCVRLSDVTMSCRKNIINFWLTKKRKMEAGRVPKIDCVNAADWFAHWLLDRVRKNFWKKWKFVQNPIKFWQFLFLQFFGTLFFGKCGPLQLDFFATSVHSIAAAELVPTHCVGGNWNRNVFSTKDTWPPY